MNRRWMTAALLVSGAVAAAQLPAGLSMDEAEAGDLLLRSLADGSPEVWSLRPLWMKLDVEARTALVRNGLAWVRDYSERPAFARGYAALRTQSRPQPPAESASADAQMAAQRRESEAQIAAMRESLAGYDAELRGEMEKMIAESEEALKAMYDDPEMQGFQRQALEQQSSQAQAEYRAQLVEWEREWPQDPRAMLIQRMQAFVQVCGSVDFDAELQPAPYGRKQVFKDPQQEAQSWQWKTCYRAGREPVQAALAVADDWLRDLSR